MCNVSFHNIFKKLSSYKWNNAPQTMLFYENKLRFLRQAVSLHPGVNYFCISEQSVMCLFHINGA